MHLFWFFVNPPGMVEWFIEPVEGRMYGFMNFFPLKMKRVFRNVGLPAAQAGKRASSSRSWQRTVLEDGREYIMWFSLQRTTAAVPRPDVGFARLPARRPGTFKQWQDPNGTSPGFLGLVPAGGNCRV